MLGYKSKRSCSTVTQEVNNFTIHKSFNSILTKKQQHFRCKMRQKDPRLFYLSMEISIRRSNARTQLILDDDARPAMLQACQTAGESK